LRQSQEKENLLFQLLREEGLSKMSRIWLTSDTHFFHVNIIKYCNRPWADVDQMTEGLIKNWNSVVGRDDEVYHLGDFAMGGKRRAEDLARVLGRLNGRIHLVRGNHDDYVLKSPCVERFEWVKDYHELRIPDVDAPNGRSWHVPLFHFPMLTWHKAGRDNVFHCHGHCHGGIRERNRGTRRVDVGVDCNNYFPFSTEQLAGMIKDITYEPVDHHSSKTTY
jgi:calcineurin-like phosphoesterase family protein